MKNFTQIKLVILVSLFLLLFDNYTFFKNVLEVYPVNSDNLGFLLSMVLVLFSVFILVFTLLSSRYTTKPILMIVLIISSLTSYFMNSYSIVVDDDMIRNIVQTNMNESLDLLTVKQVLYLSIFGLLPAYLVYKINITYKSFKKELVSKLIVIGLSIGIIVASALLFSKHYSSFAREHKPLRFSTNPIYWIYSTGKYIKSMTTDSTIVVEPTAEDAVVVQPLSSAGKIVIMVVGEAARADHFSLNGYTKETNPFLKKENIINFSNMQSCGTSTAVSVPCMFSIYNKDQYSYKKGRSKENVLDVLTHTDTISVLWRDNNSDSKGVALRVPYQDYKVGENNTICVDGECRDIGMLVGLDEYIQNNKNKDILIVLHQMGNHGPAYYKRYTKEFEKFKPVCKTNQLEQCTQEEISNAYDNAILYTDYFLSQTINFLKKYDKTHKTALIYMSDHGESLGENGIYLHGLPYFIAPQAQTRVASFIWLGDKIVQELDIQKLETKKDTLYSHDNLFSTLLGLFKVQTDVYDKEMDILYGE